MLLSVRALCEGVQDGLHLGERCREVASRIDAQRVWPHARASKNELPVGFEIGDNRELDLRPGVSPEQFEQFVRSGAAAGYALRHSFQFIGTKQQGSGSTVKLHGVERQGLLGKAQHRANGLGTGEDRIVGLNLHTITDEKGWVDWHRGSPDCQSIGVVYTVGTIETKRRLSARMYLPRVPLVPHAS